MLDHRNHSFSPTTTINNNDNGTYSNHEEKEKQQQPSSSGSSLLSKFWKLFQQQLACNDNRYALQMGVAFLLATLFVVVEPISKFAPNAFWVGVSVVTVLDNSVGGFLSLSIQRMIGTFIGGGLSIVVMTISRAIFPVWSPGATVFLCFLMFCQVFAIARIKLRPNMNYAGGIGLLTTVIILLSGYPNLIHDKISGCAELGFWRVFDLIVGIIIAMWASLCIFPLKARNTMRKNLGEALQEAADLYERAAIYCLDLSHTQDVSKLPLNLPIERRRKSNKQPPRQTTIHIEEPLHRPLLMPTTLNQDMEIWNHELVNELCDKAFRVLSRLQTEATRLRSVSKEYYLQGPFHYLLSCGSKEKCRKDLRRTKQYSDSIDAMKRIVWPLVSFRLLLPLIKHHHLQQQDMFSNYHDRVTPTQALLENFEDSLWVMRKLAAMLKDTKRKLSDEPDWPMLQWRVMNGTSLVQQELLETIRISQNSDAVDGLKLLSYYGFLVRCSTIWQGLESIVNELGPQPQIRRSGSSFSRVSYPPSSQGTLHAQE
ncbi:aluminum activated malate transporter-domain-containing protein [Phascolomyces articulosus]|uniref:Aluminum activated malate transporter-domain-containing protein n=1 Tax=Phascolomyces articulosus TaxID=60185 RepID=A0AAD5PIW8_9FUNG|nr:aluminum activated malate transporter-domain-containing protein [Phascolomyces articulosus]